METPIFNDIPSFSLILAYIAAMGLSLMMLPSIRAVSRRWSLYDFNINREVTLNHIPRLGGIALVVGFAVSAAIFTPIGCIPGIRFILAALFLLLVVGLQDDLLHLSSFMRIIFVVAAGAIITDIAKMPLLQTNLPLIFNYPLANLLITYTIFAVCVLALIQVLKVPGLLSLILMVISSALSASAIRSGIPALAISPLALAGASSVLFFSALGKYVFEGRASALTGGFVIAVMIISRYQQADFLFSLPSITSGFIVLLVFPILVFFKFLKFEDGKIILLKYKFDFTVFMISTVILLAVLSIL
jgi:UDP-N-acetylmuramyl pentapeptide phosphotransferase/UDP-N-acetylglucosamine-1-phosphate transferase